MIYLAISQILGEFIGSFLLVEVYAFWIDTYFLIYPTRRALNSIITSNICYWHFT